MKYSPLELFVKARKNTLPENIWVCVAAALTSTFYFYEYQYESFAHIRRPLLLIMTAVIFVIWIVCSLFSGRDGRFGFAVFTFLYWELPFVYTLYYAGRNNVKHYNKWLSLLNKICTAMLCNPFSEASEKINMTPQTMAELLVMVSLAVYLGAFFLKRWCDAKAADSSGEAVVEPVIGIGAAIEAIKGFFQRATGVVTGWADKWAAKGAGKSAIKGAGKSSISSADKSADKAALKESTTMTLKEALRETVKEADSARKTTAAEDDSAAAPISYQDIERFLMSRAEKKEVPEKEALEKETPKKEVHKNGIRKKAARKKEAFKEEVHQHEVPDLRQFLSISEYNAGVNAKAADEGGDDSGNGPWVVR